MTTEATALKRYNSLFDNQQYQIVTQTITNNLNVERESVTASDAANLITDAALGLSDHPSYAKSCHALAVFCGRNRIQPQTIDVIYNYLVVFQQAGDTRAEDFEAVAKACYHIQHLKPILPIAVSHTSCIHSWHGRMSYNLLASADYLIQAAQALLVDDNENYAAEKLQSGLRRITGALYEGVRYSERPELFNFSTTYFPTEQDRR